MISGHRRGVLIRRTVSRLLSTGPVLVVGFLLGAVFVSVPVIKTLEAAAGTINCGSVN